LDMFLTSLATQIFPTMKLIFENFGSLIKNTTLASSTTHFIYLIHGLSLPMYVFQNYPYKHTETP